MTDNTTLNAGTGGDVIRAEDKNGVKTQVMLLDMGGTGAESLVSPSNPLPIAVSSFPGRLAATLTANTPLDASLFGDVEFQFTTGTVSVTRSLDGTAYKFTIDGTHPSKDGHSGVASQATPTVLRTVFGF